MQSPFEVLGVEPDADEATVRRAYRERVKQVHPDAGGSADEFQRVREAYEAVLTAREEGDADWEGDAAAAGPEPRGPAGSGPAAAGPDAGRDPGPAGDRRDPGRTREGGRSDDAGGATGGTGEDGGSQVEYLNYDVIDDHGWDVGDPDLFEKASAADLDHEDYGRLFVGGDETLLEAAENRGFAWPFACRGGACTNCAVAVTDGEMPDPPGHILTDDLIEQGIRLSCISAPTTDEAKVIFNVKHLPGVDELRLPPHRFERAHADD